jgi:opacity protein-like surface antigen
VSLAAFAPHTRGNPEPALSANARFCAAAAQFAKMVLSGNFGMRTLLVVTTLIFLVSLPSMAQQTSPGEAGAGYTFRSYSLPAVQQPPSRLSMNGWNGTIDYNINLRFGAALDVDWTSNNSNGIHTEIGTALAGPQIYPFGHHKVTAFAHALFGGGRYYFRYPCGCLGANGNSDYFVQYAFAWEVGAGVDYTVRPQVAIRFLQVDYEGLNFNLEGFGRGPVPVQSSWKFSTVFLLRF